MEGALRRMCPIPSHAWKGLRPNLTSLDTLAAQLGTLEVVLGAEATRGGIDTLVRRWKTRVCTRCSCSRGWLGGHGLVPTTPRLDADGGKDAMQGLSECDRAGQRPQTLDRVGHC